MRLAIHPVDRDAHLDAIFAYADETRAIEIGDQLREVWGMIAEEMPENFDGDSLAVRTEGRRVIMHGRIVAMVDDPGVNQRVLMALMMSVATRLGGQGF